jgi:hypothetical protein
MWPATITRPSNTPPIGWRDGRQLELITWTGEESEVLPPCERAPTMNEACNTFYALLQWNLIVGQLFHWQSAADVVLPV